MTTYGKGLQDPLLCVFIWTTQNGCKLSNTETVAHTLRIEVNKKPEMCATVPHGVTRPSPDPSEGFSQLFTELPSSPTFSPKKENYFAGW